MSLWVLALRRFLIFILPDLIPEACREFTDVERSHTATPLNRARSKAYIRLLPLLFLSYVIAYVDRVNVSLATIQMSKDLPAFNNAVVGFGAGVFFIGYFILEIPGTLIVEKWSPEVDLPDHDLLGTRCCVHSLRENALSVLCGPIHARFGRGWVFPWRNCVSDALVSRT